MLNINLHYNRVKHIDQKVHDSTDGFPFAVLNFGKDENTLPALSLYFDHSIEVESLIKHLAYLYGQLKVQEELTNGKA